MENKPSVLLLSTSAGVRLALAHALKEEGFHDISHPKVSRPEEISSALVDQFKKNNTPNTPKEKRELVILNCRKNMEYRRALENLSKEIMKNRFKWGKEGISFSLDNVNSFIDSCIINHFVLGADFVYQIENNQKVRVSFGDINTDEFLSCANLFGELGISLSTYYEKELQPTPKDVQGYNEALNKGKQDLARKLSEGQVSQEEVSETINKRVRECSLGKKAGLMRKRLIKDIDTFLEESGKRKDISKKRVDIVESADAFKQYLLLKDEALTHKDNKNYEAMERTLKKAIDLLESTGESGQKSLFDTYIELGKSQVQQKKFVSSQRNAANAKKIRKEAPSPQRLMCECQMGQATEALKRGDYDTASGFFDKAEKHMEESRKMAKDVEEDEEDENEREIAISVSYFKEEAQKVVESDPRAAEILKSSLAYNMLAKTASDLKKKHKIVEEGEIHPDISTKELNHKLHEANKLLKTPADPSACTEILRKLFEADAERTADQLFKMDGLISSIMGKKSDHSRYERALVFIRTAMGYDTALKDTIEAKFHEVNTYIARDQIEDGMKLMRLFLENPGGAKAASNKDKAAIHFQKAFHQFTEIIEEVATMAVEQINAVRNEFGNREGILIADMCLKVEFSDEEKKMLTAIRETREGFAQQQEQAKKTALEATELLLDKKRAEARKKYEEAIKIDDVSAFRAASGMAKDLKSKGQVRKAYDLYSWLARVDRNETDLQYINAAWCCLILGERDRAVKHLDAALHINKDVMLEAAEMDPEFEESEVMRFYKEEEEKKKKAREAAKSAEAARIAKENKNLMTIKKAAHELAAKKQDVAYDILHQLHELDSTAFERLATRKPAVKKMQIYLFYEKYTLTGERPPKPPPLDKKDLLFITEVNRLFARGKTREAATKLIQALKRDQLILVKACEVSEKFKRSTLMRFYFRNKVKLPKFLGFNPLP